VGKREERGTSNASFVDWLRKKVTKYRAILRNMRVMLNITTCKYAERKL
jgi:hypothetical protein